MLIGEDMAVKFLGVSILNKKILNLNLNFLYVNRNISTISVQLKVFYKKIKICFFYIFEQQ